MLLWHSGRVATDADLLARANALAAVVDREVGTAKSTLRTLATSPALDTGNLEEFYRQLVLTPKPPGARIVLADAAGRQLVNSRATFGSLLPPRANPAIIHEVFQTGQAATSGMFIGSSTGKMHISVDVPVERGGLVVYDLSMSIEPAAFASALRQQMPPSDEWVAALVDGDGQMIARLPELGGYLGQKATGEALRATRTSVQRGNFTSHTVTGEPTRAAFSSVPHTGWSAVISVRRKAVDAVLWQSLLIVFSVGSGLFALGVYAAIYQARRISKSISGLSSASSLPAGSTGLLEVDEVAAAMVTAAEGRRHAELALRESEGRFRSIADAMPQIVWSARPDGTHDYHNRRWFDFVGRPPCDAMAPQEWYAAFHPDDLERARSLWQQCVSCGDPYELEYRLKDADGNFHWMLGRALPVKDMDTGRVARWFGTSTDIGEAVAAREALARSREELEMLVAERTSDLETTQVKLAQAQRMDALGQLAGGIAHDFNNVLQAVQGGATLIARRPAESDRVQRYAGMIHEAADRGAAITRRLLSFSRRGDLRAEPIAPQGLLPGMGELMSHTLGAGIEVNVEVEPGTPALMADKGQLETVLINLATNARDAMCGTGTILLRAGHETVEAQADDRLPPGRYVVLSVSDTGSGMDAGTLERASEPFFTTKARGQGTGLGLSMARGFAEQSGGAIAIRSKLGEGTTVAIWLPAAGGNAALAALPPAGESHPLLASRPARLMLVDDEAIVLETLSRQMEDWGYTVLTAGSAADALELLDRGERVDLIVSDLSMPRMDGMTFLREAHRRVPGVPAILLTGFATNTAETAIGGSVEGPFTLLRKPVEGRALAERVALLLEAG